MQFTIKVRRWSKWRSKLLQKRQRKQEHVSVPVLPIIAPPALRDLVSAGARYVVNTWVVTTPNKGVCYF